MSKALDYLLAARPDAMGNYFSFLKEAGKHLDPKTRAIISVITKIENQTEKGFRQYLQRALREGVSANEMLDAMLVAFPTLGLTKIVWAIDQIIEMDLAEFKLENLGASDTWHKVSNLADIEGLDFKGIYCDGRPLFIKYDGNEYRVYDGVCPHQSTPIPVDALEGSILTCPGHKWRFDLSKGYCVANGNKPLKVLDSRIESDYLFACW